MNTIRILIQAAQGDPAHRIDAGVLNDALTTANLQPGWSASHNDSQAIVDCDPADEQTVRGLIAAHVDDTDRRESNKVVLKQIVAIEAKVTQRMLRERGALLTNLDNQIAALRATLT